MLLSFALTALFTYSISPLFSNPNSIGTDSNIAQAIGRMMVEGQTPYIDIYDHKGPYLLYLAYLSASIHPIGGFYIIQSILNAMTIFTIIDLAIESKMAAARLVPFLMVVLTAIYFVNEGVAVDYSFAPFSYLSLYLFLLSLMRKSSKLMMTSSLFAGILLGVALFSRASNAMIELLVALGIVLFAWLNKQPKSLLNYIPLGGLGLAISVALPLIISYANGYLIPMHEWTFAKNFAYAASVDPTTLEGKLVIPWVIVLGVICLAILLLGRKRILRSSPTLFLQIVLDQNRMYRSRSEWEMKNPCLSRK